MWHEGTEDRVVLICDLWHPDLKLETAVRPQLSERQCEAMDRALKGEHLLLTERTYSTGASVSRGD